MKHDFSFLRHGATFAFAAALAFSLLAPSAFAQTEVRYQKGLPVPAPDQRGVSRISCRSLCSGHGLARLGMEQREGAD